MDGRRRDGVTAAGAVGPSVVLALRDPLEGSVPVLTGMLRRALAGDPADRDAAAGPSVHDPADRRSTAAPPGAARRPGAVTGAALGRVQRAAGSRCSAVVDLTGDDCRVAEATAGFDAEQVAPILDQVARYCAAHRRDILGLVAATPGGPPVLAIPLTLARGGDARRALVLVDPAPALLEVGEPVALVLHELWLAAETGDPADAELRVLTALRREFGRLPLALYRHALEVYRRRLEALTIVFEPVVSLDPEPTRVRIESWEALARSGPGQRAAPAELLDTADVWGPEFVIERDVTLARASLRSYVEAHRRSPFRVDPPRPLSINVSVRSVMSDAYAAHLRTVIQETGLGPGRLVLEISEKDPVAPAPGEIWLDHPMETFRRRLAHLTQALRVDFAVDDFGVGHASLDRISSLTLTQIKIDRAVLAHPLAADEIALVVRIAQHAPPGGAAVPRSVVMEGFDRNSPVPLVTVFGAGVQLVQGYITEGPGSGELQPLGGARETIAALLGTDA